MNALSSHSLIIFAANQVFTATQVNAFTGNQVIPITQVPAVYVGTNPPSGETCSAIRYKHPVDFGVLFQGTGNGWFASTSENIRYFHATMQRVGHIFQSPEHRFPAEIPEGKLALQSGIYVFYFDERREEHQFQAHVFENALPAQPGMNVEFKTRLQKEWEDLEILVAKRIELARIPGGVDAHNLAVLEEDLKERLSRPKTRMGGRQITDLFEAALNAETGKLIALLPVDFFSREAPWPTSASGCPRYGRFHFDSSWHVLRGASLSLPASLERAVGSFNERFGEKPTSP